MCGCGGTGGGAGTARPWPGGWGAPPAGARASPPGVGRWRGSRAGTPPRRAPSAGPARGSGGHHPAPHLGHVGVVSELPGPVHHQPDELREGEGGSRGRGGLAGVEPPPYPGVPWRHPAAAPGHVPVHPVPVLVPEGGHQGGPARQPLHRRGTHLGKGATLTPPLPTCSSSRPLVEQLVGHSSRMKLSGAYLLGLPPFGHLIFVGYPYQSWKIILYADTRRSRGCLGAWCSNCCHTLPPGHPSILPLQHT